MKFKGRNLKGMKLNSIDDFRDEIKSISRNKYNFTSMTPIYRIRGSYPHLGWVLRDENLAVIKLDSSNHIQHEIASSSPPPP